MRKAAAFRNPAGEESSVRRTSLALAASTLTFTCLGAGYTGVALASPGGTAAHATAGPALSVDLLAGRHAINRDIYEMNFAPASLERHLKLPVVR